MYNSVKSYHHLSLTSHLNVVVVSSQVEWGHPVLVPSHHISMAPQQLLHSVLVATGSSMVEGSQPLAVLEVHLTTYSVYVCRECTCVREIESVHVREREREREREIR